MRCDYERRGFNDLRAATRRNFRRQFRHGVMRMLPGMNGVRRTDKDVMIRRMIVTLGLFFSRLVKVMCR